MVDVEVLGERLSLILLGVNKADVLLREQELGAVPGVLSPQHGNVQLAIQHLLVEVAAVAGGDVQPDAGVALMVLCQHIGELVIGKVHRHTGFQGAAGLALHGIQLPAQLFHLPQGGTAALQHLLPRRGKANALPRAEQDLHPQLLFHGFDPFGQRRLGHIQLIRRMGDVAGLIQRFQQFKVFFVHRGSPLFSVPVVPGFPRLALRAAQPFTIPFLHLTMGYRKRKAPFLQSISGKSIPSRTRTVLFHKESESFPAL